MNQHTITQCVLFPGISSRPVVAKFDQPQGSSDGGAILLRAADQRLHFTCALGQALEEERQSHKIKHELVELARAVAQSGHSASLLHVIAEREQELAEIEKSLCQDDANGSLQAEELRDFAITRLSALPELLCSDISRARAELALQIDSVKMTPTEEDGNRRYVCEGDWNLIGTLTGDVRMVAGA